MMNKIGLFYGTDTGNTEVVANKIKELIEQKMEGVSVEVSEIYKKDASDLNPYTFLIIGMPTWYDGELQGDWETFLPKFEQIDFKNKYVAFFGLGDQYGYSFYFCDALGVFFEIAKKNGATICGQWSTDGYEYDASKAEIDGQLVGLCLDTDNQDDLTESRLEQWTLQILNEFSII